MEAKSDAPVSGSERAATRRWLITLAITVAFGGFGAVMAYMSYANSSKPAPSRSRPSSVSPQGAPSSTPQPAEPVRDDRPGKDKRDRDKSDRDD